MQAKLDMTRLEHPVVMNANPLLCEPASPAYPRLTPTGVYTGQVSHAIMAASGGGGQSSSAETGVNNVQVNAFQCVGGDPASTITGVQVKTDSAAINLLFALMSSVTINVAGTVQKITLPQEQAKGGPQ